MYLRINEKHNRNKMIEPLYRIFLYKDKWIYTRRMTPHLMLWTKRGILDSKKDNEITKDDDVLNKVHIPRVVKAKVEKKESKFKEKVIAEVDTIKILSKNPKPKKFVKKKTAKDEIGQGETIEISMKSNKISKVD